MNKKCGAVLYLSLFLFICAVPVSAQQLEAARSEAQSVTKPAAEGSVATDMKELKANKQAEKAIKKKKKAIKKEKKARDEISFPQHEPPVIKE